MDQVDRAQIEEERRLEDALKRSRAPAGPAAIGYCLYCSAPVPDGHRWCDEFCRDDWEFEQARLAQKRQDDATYNTDMGWLDE